MISVDQRSTRFQYGLDVYGTITADAFGDELNPGLAALEPQFPFLVDAAMSFAIGDVGGRSEMTAELARSR